MDCFNQPHTSSTEERTQLIPTCAGLCAACWQEELPRFCVRKIDGLWSVVRRSPNYLEAHFPLIDRKVRFFCPLSFIPFFLRQVKRVVLRGKGWLEMSWTKGSKAQSLSGKVMWLNLMGRMRRGKGSDSAGSLFFVLLSFMLFHFSHVKFWLNLSKKALLIASKFIVLLFIKEPSPKCRMGHRQRKFWSELTPVQGKVQMSVFVLIKEEMTPNNRSCLIVPNNWLF